MRPVAAVAVLLLLAGAGCLDVLGPDPAPLPPEGEVFTVVTRGCGQQLVPHEDVWITYPDRGLYHFVVAVETNRTDEDGQSDPEDERPGDVNISYEDAIRVLGQANATGAFPLGFYDRESRENGFARLDLWHAERHALDGERFDALRRQVTRADLAARDARYTEPANVADGCGIDLAAWTGDGYAHIYRTSGNGPEPVIGLEELHASLHPAS